MTSIQLVSVKDTTKHVGEEIPTILSEIEVTSSQKHFIEANTIVGSLHEMNNTHLVPVFVRENVPLISQGEFIDVALQAVKQVFNGEQVLMPDIRLSHIIQGRVSEAKHKPANELLEHEKTIFYDRMAFTIEIPTIYTEVAGNRLNLMVCGVKCYSNENLMSKHYEQHFKVCIGYTNRVCTNLCIATDGMLRELKVRNLQTLYNGITSMCQEFNAHQFSEQLRLLPQYNLTEVQFAQLIGRARMYRYLPDVQKQLIQELKFGDAQLNAIVKDYYADKSFCRSSDGSINLWRLYNLFTGANKSSYIDNFLERGANAFELVSMLQVAIEHRADCWYLN